jgi:hypothetical protein
MKQFKSDGRYKYHDKGFHYIVEFRWSHYDDRQLYIKLLNAFTEIYGPEKDKFISEHGYTLWKWNQDWRCEQNRGAKRRRIYLREESVLSLALLRVEI